MILSSSTDIKEESFTRRFLRRASTNDSAKRKLNILQAINTSETTTSNTDILRCKNEKNRSNTEKLERFNDDETVHLKTNDLFSKEVRVKNTTEGSGKDVNRKKEFEETDNGWKYYDKRTPSCNIATPKLVKVKKRTIPTPEKMQTFLRNITEHENSKVDLIEQESAINQDDNERDERSTITDMDSNEAIQMDETNETNAPYADLNEAIRDLERDIEFLELGSNANGGLYSSKMFLDLENDRGNWNGISESEHRIAVSKYKKNKASKAKKPKRMKPNLESTRKSPTV